MKNVLLLFGFIFVLSGFSQAHSQDQVTPTTVTGPVKPLCPSLETIK